MKKSISEKVKAARPDLTTYIDALRYMEPDWPHYDIVKLTPAGDLMIRGLDSYTNSVVTFSHPEHVRECIVLFAAVKAAQTATPRTPLEPGEIEVKDCRFTGIRDIGPCYLVRLGAEIRTLKSWQIVDLWLTALAPADMLRRFMTPVTEQSILSARLAA